MSRTPIIVTLLLGIVTIFTFATYAEASEPYLIPGDYATLSAGISATGTNRVTFQIVGPSSVTSNITVPSNISLIFTVPGELNISSGVTLTIDGPVEAGLFQIFSGAGTVAGNLRTATIYPEWFYSGSYNDETADWAPAINAAILLADKGCRNVTLQSQAYNVKSTINLSHPGNSKMSDMVLQSAVRTTQYQQGARLIGNTGSGNCVIETTDVDGVYLKNIAVLRGKTDAASDIGIVQARGAMGTRYWAGDQYHENVYVNMGSNIAANNTLGTIGFVNLAAEETRWHNLQVWANLPLVITWTDTCQRTRGDLSGQDSLTFTSDVGIGLAQNSSNTVFRLSGLSRLIAYDYVSPCVLLNATATVDLGHTFLQKRASGAGAAAGSHHYAIENWNVYQFRHWGAVEGCHSYLLNRRDFTQADVNVRLANAGETSLPIIQFFDDGGIYRFQDVRMTISPLNKNRPLMCSGRYDGNNEEPMKFSIRNCDLMVDMPLNMTTLNDKRILRNTTNTTMRFSNDECLKITNRCISTDISKDIGTRSQNTAIARIHMPTYIANRGSFTAAVNLRGSLSNAGSSGVGAPSANSFMTDFNIANGHNSQMIHLGTINTASGNPVVVNSGANEINSVTTTATIDNTNNWITIYAQPVTSGVNNASVQMEAELTIRWNGAYRDSILIEKM